MITPTRKRRAVVVPGEQPAAVEHPQERASDLPTPDQVDSSKISHMVLTTEGWIAGTNIPGGGR